MDKISKIKEIALKKENFIKGEFLLTSANFDDRWILINDVTRQAEEKLTEITCLFLKNFIKYTKKSELLIVLPKYNDTYQSDSKINSIFKKAAEDVMDNSLNPSLKINFIYADDQNGRYEFTKDYNHCMNKSTIIALPVSSYTRTVEQVSIQSNRRLRCSELYIYTPLCREISIIRDLKELNVPVQPIIIPLLFYHKDHLYTVHEMDEYILEGLDYDLNFVRSLLKEKVTIS